MALADSRLESKAAENGDEDQPIPKPPMARCRRHGKQGGRVRPEPARAELVVFRLPATQPTRKSRTESIRSQAGTGRILGYSGLRVAYRPARCAKSLARGLTRAYGIPFVAERE
jgi:hypothetical protein